VCSIPFPSSLHTFWQIYWTGPAAPIPSPAFFSSCYLRNGASQVWWLRTIRPVFWVASLSCKGWLSIRPSPKSLDGHIFRGKGDPQSGLHSNVGAPSINCVPDCIRRPEQDKSFQKEPTGRRGGSILYSQRLSLCFSTILLTFFLRRIGIRDLAYSIATYIMAWQKNLSSEVDDLKGIMMALDAWPTLRRNGHT
jgi:hypothetical protein